MHRLPSIAVALVLLLLALPNRSHAAGEEEALFQPRTLLGGEYWGTLPDEGYLEYLAAVKPDLIHGGVLGPELCSAVYGKGALKGITPIYPAVATIKEYLDWWRTFNAQAHERGVKVQATTSLTLLWGDHEQKSGFFKYYAELWEADVLGPKPADKPEAFLRVDGEGKLIRDKYGDWYTYAGCVNNPLWRALLKAMVKPGVAAGFDGYMVQFPYFDERCLCVHCVEKFKAFLGGRFDKATLAKDLGITDLAAHKFTRIGSPVDKKNAKLDLAAREFAALSVKDCVDEVFIDYGRTLAPGLVVSQWSHFRQFLTEDATNTDFASYLDERTLLPIERWGQGENYLWYSSPMYQSDLKKGQLGDSALDGRVLRAMAGKKAFELLKYDYYRWRLVTAESLASGGVSFGARAGGWSGGADREEPHHLQSYFQFIRDHDQYLNPRQRDSHGEAVLLYPRQGLFAGDATFFGTFRDVGRALLQGHVLFDVIIDQKMTAADLAGRRAVFVVAPQYLTPAQGEMLQDYVKAGGKLILAISGPAGCTLTALQGDLTVANPADRPALMQALARLAAGEFSTFNAPITVQVYADRQRQAKRLLVHLVNFNRDESQKNKELPIAAPPVQFDLRLPADFQPKSVQFLTPEAKAAPVEFTLKGDRLQLTTPIWLVYGLVVIQAQ